MRKKLDPDKPHKFQVRRVTLKGKRLVGWDYSGPMWGVEFTSHPEKPCRHCGGSEGLPVHFLASR